MQRQYCGALGKIGNCQVAVSSALIADGRTWPLAFELYLPDVVDRRCRAPRRRRDSADRAVSREVAHRVGAGARPSCRRASRSRAWSSMPTTEQRRVPRRPRAPRPRLWRRDPRRGGVHRRGVDGPAVATALADSAPDDAWETVTWGTGTAGPLTARFCALRVRPPTGRGDRWLLCERSATDVRKYYLLHLPPTTPLVDLVALARSRWPIEQQYRELKDDLGLDHFEGRTLSGLDASRRPHGRRVHLPPNRTGTRHRRPPAHAARRPWLGPRNHGPALRHAQPAATRHARQLPPERAAPKVTK